MRVNLILTVVLLAILEEFECARQVGKCLDRRGHLRCQSNQVCAARKKLCVPYTMSRKCRCKANKVKGCEDLVGRSVCEYNEECVNKRTGKPCTKQNSKYCKCLQSTTTTEPSMRPPVAPPGMGCFVGVDNIRIFIPFDRMFHDIEGLPCKKCICMPGYPHFKDYCRVIPDCNSALQLFVGK